MTTPAELDAPPPRPPNRRERRKIETRAALEEAALRLFAEKGYEQTTVEEIAAAADVAVRTFFRYFASKRHVLFGDAAHDRVPRTRAALATRPAGEPPIDSIRAVLDLLELDPEQEGPVLRRLRLMERQPSLRVTYLALNDELRLVFAAFVAERTGLPLLGHPYPLALAAATAASWDVALSLWAAADGRRPLRALRQEAFDMLTAGLRTVPRQRPPSR
ncbi:MAG TPA: TetR family transcriptional regulator [Pilimelia sp.]|nr:TetR family transcriptional regulator [Pilimelia sp.]